MHISSCLPLDTYMCLMGDIYRPNPEIRLPEFICSSPQLLFKVQPNSARVPIDDALLGGKMLCKHCIVVLLTSRDICTVGGILRSSLRLPGARGGWQGRTADPPGGPPGGPSSPAVGTSCQGFSGGPSPVYGPSPPSVTAF